MNKVELLEIKALTPNRYVLKVKKDDQEEKLTLLSDTLLEIGLFKPRVLSTEEYQVLKDSSVIDELKSKAIHYVTFQARLTSEVRSFLEKKGASSKQIDSIIKALKDAGLLDDQAYIKAMIDTAIQYEQVGPYKVKEKLMKKGADLSLVDQSLRVYTHEKEARKLRNLLDKDIRHTFKKPLTKTLQSLKQKYVTKGFSLTVVDSVVEEYRDDIKARIDEEYLLGQEIKKMPKTLLEPKNKQKLIAKLMRKGYAYSLIKKRVKGGDIDEHFE